MDASLQSAEKSGEQCMMVDDSTGDSSFHPCMMLPWNPCRQHVQDKTSEREVYKVTNSNSRARGNSSPHCSCELQSRGVVASYLRVPPPSHQEVRPRSPILRLHRGSKSFAQAPKDARRAECAAKSYLPTHTATVVVRQGKKEGVKAKCSMSLARPAVLPFAL